MRGLIATTGLLLLMCGVVSADETISSRESTAPSIWQPRLNPLRAAGEQTSDPSPRMRPPSPPRTPLERLRDELEGPDQFRAIAATEELRSLGPEGAAVMLESLTNDRLDGSARFSVYRVLTEMAADLGPALEQTIRGPREKWFGLGPLVEPLKMHAPRIVPLLSDVVRDPSADADSRSTALHWLSEMGSAASRSADALVTRFKQSDDDEERSQVLRTLIALGDVPKLDTRPVLECLLDEQQMAELRVLAARMLLTQRSVSPSVMPALINMIEEDLAKDLLGGLGRRVVPAVANVLQDRSASLKRRIAAVKTLARIGPDSTSSLIAAVGDDDELDEEICQALMMIGPRKGIPEIYQFLRQTAANPSQRPVEELQRQSDHLQKIIIMLSSESGGWGGGDAPAAAAAPQLREIESFGTGGNAAGSSSGPGSASTGLSGVASGSGGIGGGDGDRGGEAGGSFDLPAWMPSAAASPPAAGSPPAAAADPEPARTIGESIRATGSAVEPLAASPIDSDLKLVKVFYATNRKPLDTVYERRAVEWRAFLPTIIFGSVTMLLSAFGFALAASPRKAALAAFGFVITLVLAYPAAQRSVDLESSAANRPGPVYGGESNNDIQLGTCEVTIPSTHRIGELESPAFFRLEVQDPHKHIVVRKVQRADHEGFYAELKRDLAARGSHILVFVHGYNVSFDDAARRTAQMSTDLNFNGAPIFFSWPSQGNWYEYREDEKQVELAVNPLKTFLLDVARRSGASSIHLVAHSMGNRALTEALREIETEAGQHTLFNQVVLAAPDIDAQVFRERIAPAITAKAQRVTLYASSNDLALLASRTFNSGDYRAGDASGSVIVVPGIETIDVSDVDSSLLGHSYYGSSPTVLTDLKELLSSARPAAERESLEAVTSTEYPYWIFRHPTIASRPAMESPPR